MCSKNRVPVKLASSSEHIRNMFKAFREQDEFIDVTIECDGGEIRAHKIVLAACSPYLRGILSSDSSTVDCRGLRHKDLMRGVQLMYDGEMTISTPKMKKISKIAEKLKLILELPQQGNEVATEKTQAIAVEVPKGKVLQA